MGKSTKYLASGVLASALLAGGMTPLMGSAANAVTATPINANFTSSTGSSICVGTLLSVPLRPAVESGDSDLSYKWTLKNANGTEATNGSYVAQLPTLMDNEKYLTYKVPASAVGLRINLTVGSWDQASKNWSSYALSADTATVVKADGCTQLATPMDSWGKAKRVVTKKNRRGVLSLVGVSARLNDQLNANNTRITYKWTGPKGAYLPGASTTNVFTVVHKKATSYSVDPAAAKITLTVTAQTTGYAPAVKRYTFKPIIKPVKKHGQKASHKGGKK